MRARGFFKTWNLEYALETITEFKNTRKPKLHMRMAAENFSAVQGKYFKIR